MLKLIITGTELFDESTGTFSSFDNTELELEHSLLSMSKWEAKFEKAFLAPGTKTTPEVLEYVKMMIITPGQSDDIWGRFTQENVAEVNAYIDSPQSATTFPDRGPQPPSREKITSELIYYWMVAYKIPFECQSWHLNRLFALIRICGLKNSKPKKMSASQLAQHNRQLNAQRREQFNTNG